MGLNLGAAPPNPSEITLRLKHVALVPKCDCKKGNRKKAWKAKGGSHDYGGSTRQNHHRNPEQPKRMARIKANALIICFYGAKFYRQQYYLDSFVVYCIASYTNGREI